MSYYSLENSNSSNRSWGEGLLLFSTPNKMRLLGRSLASWYSEELANIFWWGQTVNILGFVDHMICYKYSTQLMSRKSGYGQIHEQVSYVPINWIYRHWHLNIIHVLHMGTYSSFDFFFNPLKYKSVALLVSFIKAMGRSRPMYHRSFPTTGLVEETQSLRSDSYFTTF